MTPVEFKENQVWGHRYGGTPEQNAHMLVKNIDDELYLVNKYHKIPLADTKPDKNVIYFCGEYNDYYKNIIEKEGYDG